MLSLLPLQPLVPALPFKPSSLHSRSRSKGHGWWDHLPLPCLAPVPILPLFPLLPALPLLSLAGGQSPHNRTSHRSSTFSAGSASVLSFAPSWHDLGVLGYVMSIWFLFFLCHCRHLIQHCQINLHDDLQGFKLTSIALSLRVLGLINSIILY